MKAMDILKNVNTKIYVNMFKEFRNNPKDIQISQFKESFFPTGSG